MNKRFFGLVTVIFMIVLTGCTLFPNLPGSQPAQPTTEPSLTAVPATATLAPSPTQPLPSDTPVATSTQQMPYITSMPIASYTPTSTASYSIGHITPTPVSGTPKPNIVEYSCYQTVQEPPIGARYHTRDEFDAHWQIVNRDMTDWLASETVVYYANGTKMQTYHDKINLAHDVKSGKAVDIIIDMTVPPEPGFYSTSWIVANKGRVVCILTVSINAY